MENNNYKDSMVLYESSYLAIEYLPTNELKWEATKGLLDYGFYGVIPESDNPFVNMIYVQAIPSLRNAKQRYEKARENGDKGGRPTNISIEEILEMKKNGLTNKQVAEQVGCSVKNIEKRITTYNKRHPTNPTNLSVSVSVSESVSVSDSGVANAPSEEKRDFSLCDLDNDKLHGIISSLDKGVRYIDIQRKYSLSCMVTKDTKLECQKILTERAFIAQQEREAQERAQQQKIDYNRVSAQAEAHVTTQNDDLVYDFMIEDWEDVL